MGHILHRYLHRRPLSHLHGNVLFLAYSFELLLSIVLQFAPQIIYFNLYILFSYFAGYVIKPHFKPLNPFSDVMT